MKYLIVCLALMSALPALSFASDEEQPEPACAARALKAYKAVHQSVLGISVRGIKLVSTKTAQDGAAAQWSFRFSGYPADFGGGKMTIESVVNMSYENCSFEEFIRFPEHNG